MNIQMTIEAKIQFLNTIPVTPKFELPEGVVLPGDVKVDYTGLVRDIATTMVWDHGISSYCWTSEEKLIKVINSETIEAWTQGERVILRGEAINKAKISSPTRIPGFRFRYSYG